MTGLDELERRVRRVFKTVVMKTARLRENTSQSKSPSQAGRSACPSLKPDTDLYQCQLRKGRHRS